VHALPAIEGPGACGATDVVRLEAVVTLDGRRIALNPPAVLRCPMAEALVRWLREEAGPLIAQRGAPPASLTTAASFECRGRNRVAGGKLSQHGLANALDIRGFTLADGKVVGLTDPAVAKDLRVRLQETACTRFTTVLGPGSDGYHEDHIHLDLIERRGGYRLCQWAVRDPAEAAAVAAAAAAKAAAARLPKFKPLPHQDGEPPGAAALPPSASRLARADRSGSCSGAQDCLRESLHPPSPAPRRGAARRSGHPRIVFPW
jgi:Extensin-like protein C-terminus